MNVGDQQAQALADCRKAPVPSQAGKSALVEVVTICRKNKGSGKMAAALQKRTDSRKLDDGNWTILRAIEPPVVIQSFVSQMDAFCFCSTAMCFHALRERRVHHPLNVPGGVDRNCDGAAADFPRGHICEETHGP